jgi:hypothetical protein
MTSLRQTAAMEVATLILKYVQALIWPLVVVILLLVLQSELRQLLGRLIGAEVPGAKLTFTQFQNRTAGELARASGAELDVEAELAAPDADEQEPSHPDDRRIDPPSQPSGVAESLTSHLRWTKLDSRNVTVGELLNAWILLKKELRIAYEPFRGNSPRPAYAFQTMGLPADWTRAYARVSDLMTVMEAQMESLPAAEMNYLAETIQLLRDQLHYVTRLNVDKEMPNL